MNLKELYKQIQTGEISEEDFRQKVSLGYVRTAHDSILDVNRSLRTGIPEIIYGEHKTFDQVIEIAENMLVHQKQVIVSRYPENDRIANHFSRDYSIRQDERIIVIGDIPEPTGNVLVISGGAADHPVAAEVALTLEALGVKPILYEDRGIAHPTRVLEALEEGIRKKVKLGIVIAGMEASLATFVASTVPLPIVGVPTSVGYGYRANESALHSMLASCTPNLAVVNTDGGIRAATFGYLIINNQIS